MPGAKVPITFRIFKGDSLIREETLAQPVIKVGKLSSSHLRLDDDSVSRMHAVIEVSGDASGAGEVNIIDLGSTKGTHVNGQRVNKARLQSGDRIQVGDTRLEIAIGATAGATAGKPPARAAERRPPARSGAAPRIPAASAARVAPPAAAGSARSASTARSAVPAPGAAPAPAQAVSASFGMDSNVDTGGERAIEVAAMLEGSVVGVEHLSNPRGGKITALTKGLFAAGLVLLITSGVAFSVAISNATFNKHSKEQWTAENLPAHDWRPRLVSVAYDWMAFGGLAGGIICMTIGLVRVHNERRSPWFRIGTQPGVEFPTSAAPAASFPLVGPRGDDFVFTGHADMQGELSMDGQAIPLADLQANGQARPSTAVPGAFELIIPAKARIKAKVGQTTFLVSSVPRARKQATALFASLESRAMAYFAGSAIVHMSIWALLNAIPPDASALTLDLGGAEGRMTRVANKGQEDPKEPEEELEKENTEESGGTGTAMALSEGKMGKEDSKRDSGQYAMKNNGVDPQVAKQQQLDVARNAGVVGALKAMQGGAFASLTGTGDFSSGLDDANVMGGLLGDEVGEMSGGFGFGRSGFGPGGGGTGWGTIGTGSYGTIGHGSGTGSGYGVGSGRGGMRNRRASPPQVRIGNAVATGDLDKNIIRRYIRRKLPRIKYCYEKQLLVKPGISGTVNSSFQISPQGSVLSSSASGVSPEVSTCVAGVIKTIKFPKPKRGGLVQVRYPFTFRPSGG